MSWRAVNFAASDKPMTPRCDQSHPAHRLRAQALAASPATLPDRSSSSERSAPASSATARGADQDAGNDRLLVHVKPGTPLNDHLHLRLHSKEGDRDAAGIVETLPRVLPVPGGDKKWYLYAARAGLSIGVASHRRGFSLNTMQDGGSPRMPSQKRSIYLEHTPPIFCMVRSAAACVGTNFIP